MALTRHPLRAGLAWVEGSATIVGLRLLLVLIGGAPAAAATALALVGSAGRQPYFTEVTGPLPVVHLVRLSHLLGPAVWWAAVGGAVVVLLGQQLLWAGALSWLSSRDVRRPGREASDAGAARPERPPGSALGAVLEEGPRWLWPMLRVVITAAVLQGVGLYAIARGFSTLHDLGESWGLSARAVRWQLPLAQGAVMVLWAALVGAWALWCRVVLVAYRRQRVRRAALRVVTVWRRRPASALGFTLAVSLPAQLLGGIVLVAWRQLPPAGSAGLLLWGGAWLVACFLQAAAWHWLMRAALLLTAHPDLRELYNEPGVPWSWAELLARALRLGPRPPGP